MTWWQDFRKFDNRGLLIERVEGWRAYTPKGYVIDRRYFLGALCVIVALAGYLFLTAGVGLSQKYIHCPEDVPSCRNPCYLRANCGAPDWKETLAPGESYGVPPDPAFARRLRGFGVASASLILLAFCLNHFSYNMGRSFGDILPDLEEKK